MNKDINLLALCRVAERTKKNNKQTLDAHIVFLRLIVIKIFTDSLGVFFGLVFTIYSQNESFFFDPI